MRCRPEQFPLARFFAPVQNPFMSRIRYYITGHGLGHASRSCLIINHLLSFAPTDLVDIVSDAAPWFFATALRHQIPVRRETLDVGVVQQGSLRMDIAETLRRLQELQGRRNDLLQREAAALIRDRIDLVVADISPLACAAAQLAGIPAVAVGNFSWDWIYEPMVEIEPGFVPIIDQMRRDYSSASLLKLPFSPDMHQFASVEEMPLVARPGSADPAAVRQALGIADKLRLGLVSFGGFGIDGIDIPALARLKGWHFITEQPFPDGVANVIRLEPGRFAYPDLVRAADLVIGKPGYGIVSEVIANRTRMVWASRGPFREEPCLVDGLERYVPCCEIDETSLLAGHWGEAIDAVMAQPWPQAAIDSNGAEVVSHRLLELAGWRL